MFGHVVMTLHKNIYLAFFMELFEIVFLSLQRRYLYPSEGHFIKELLIMLGQIYNKSHIYRESGNTYKCLHPGNDTTNRYENTYHKLFYFNQKLHVDIL
jgi:hypothetical protein